MEGGCPNLSNQNRNHTGALQMNFTKTNTMSYKVYWQWTTVNNWQVVCLQVKDQVKDQVKWQVSGQIDQAFYKIHQETKK